MPRSTWSGSISFGLVNVPVKQVTAVRNHDIHFHMLHADDGVRLKQQRICPADGEVVAWKDIDKGYEISPGKYVKIDPAELEEMAPESSREISIQDVVPLDQIDPVYFDRTSWLVPAKGGERAYALLTRVLEESGRVAIAHMVQRTREHLVVVRASRGALVLTTLHYADEVVGPEDIDLPDMAKHEASDREVEVAGKLLSALETGFDPEAYHDDWRDQVRDLIERKAHGETFEQPATTGEHVTRTPAADIMAALEASLAAASSRRSEATSGKANAKPKSSTTKPKSKAKPAAKSKVKAVSHGKPKPRSKAAAK